MSQINEDMMVDDSSGESSGGTAFSSQNSLGITRETLEAVERAKGLEPGLFVSGWDADDNDGIAEKDMMDPAEQVLTAAEDGDLNLLKHLLNEYPDHISVRDMDQYTPLHRAAYNNHADCVAYLLDLGADLNWLTEQGWTPLHCAACWGCDAVVPLLIERGADVNARSKGDLSPLHLAVACTDSPKGAVNVVKALLSTGKVEIDCVSGAKETPYMIARRSSKAMFELFEQYKNQGAQTSSDSSSAAVQQSPSAHVS